MTHVHLIGIGGAGLSAIATVLLQQGYRVSGSDIQASAVTERLSQIGATVFTGHAAGNLAGPPDVVVVSSAIDPNNPELQTARQQGISVLKRAEWLGRMMSGQAGIAIAGTHGKTTTTAMTALLLEQAGQAPTYIVGGFVPQLKTNAAAGSGSAFVIEADEYDHTFLGLSPQVAVITIADWDHPDIFPTPDTLQQAFVDFVQLVPPEGLVVGCGDAPGVPEVIQQASARVFTYGLGPGNDWRADELTANAHGGYDFQLHSPLPDQEPVTVSLIVPGIHNVYNALAALIVGWQQGVALAQAAEIVGQFAGVERRFERKGEQQGITVIDDYAHHPTEIKATLAAARLRFGERPLWVLFQPHTFSRTLSLLNDFAEAFAEADHVVVVDIFASRERDEGLVHSGDLIDKMDHPSAHYIASLPEATDYLVERLEPPAVLLTLGAGDGYQVGEWVLERLATPSS